MRQSLTFFSRNGFFYLLQIASTGYIFTSIYYCLSSVELEPFFDVDPVLGLYPPSLPIDHSSHHLPASWRGIGVRARGRCPGEKGGIDGVLSDVIGETIVDMIAGQSDGHHWRDNGI